VSAKVDPGPATLEGPALVAVLPSLDLELAVLDPAAPDAVLCAVGPPRAPGDLRAGVVLQN
jgi:hypothetical protein